MYRTLGIVGLISLFSTSAQADVNPADLQSAQALQRVMQQTIRDVEPAIACILVSRSDYGRPVEAREEWPGKLGRFNPAEFIGAIDLVRRLDLASPQVVPESFGSGVVVDPKGLVLTNYHVVRGATKVFVRLQGGAGSYADIHAADWRSDLAVLRLLDPPPNLTTVRFGNGGKVERGEFILSIANPFAAGFRDGQPSASWGIISNVRRRVSGSQHELGYIKALHYYATLLQIDARLNLGCSGGAVVNLQGEMIGLTSSLAGIQGGESPGGFAMPIDDGMHRIIEALKRGEEVEYGFLGVGFNEQRRRNGEGVTLDNVVPGSPAQVDGNLNPGDALLAVNDKLVRESDELFLELGKQLAGNKVRLRVRRGTVPPRVEEVTVTLAKFLVPGDRIASNTGTRPYFRGLRVDYTSLLVQQELRVDERIIPQGVLVADIKPNTSAASTPLRTFDVITHVNNQMVASPAAFYQLVAGIAGPVELKLSGQKETITLR